MLLGGSEFKGETVDEYKKKEKEEEVQYRLPFGGGSGAGISINPVAFVIVSKESIKVLPIQHNSAIEKLMDYVPDLMEKADNIVDKTIENQAEKAKEKRNNNDSKKENAKSKIIKRVRKSRPEVEDFLDSDEEYLEKDDE